MSNRVFKTHLRRQMLPARDRLDVPPAYRHTAIADLLCYHNSGAPHRCYSQAEVIVGMCMDHRQRLRIPENFAYVMRAAGANFRGLDFQISTAIAIGGVRTIAIIGHDRCALSDLAARRDDFVSGLIDGAGWERHVAEQHFEEYAARFETGDPVAFTCAQARHLRHQYPKLAVAPLLYRSDDTMLYVIDEAHPRPS